MIQLFASASALLLLDQWSKSIAQRYAADRGISWGSILRIRCARHERRDSPTALVLIWFGALLAAIALNRSGTWFQTDFALFSLGLALGGAAGNLSDILRHRHIVNFIDLRWWPVFNLADAAIVVGLVAAFWPLD